MTKTKVDFQNRQYSIAKQAAEPPALDMRFSNCYI